MISKKSFNVIGEGKKYLVEFYIRSEQYVRVYNYKYDDTLNPDGSEDHLIDINNPFSFPENIYVRGNDLPKSEDLITLENFYLIDNSIGFYNSPNQGSKIYIEVATTSEEFGNTLTQSSLKKAEEAALLAEGYAQESLDNLNNMYSMGTTIETLDENDQPVISYDNVGNIMDFKIPQGKKGDIGLQGIKGDTGLQGIQGIKGDKGDIGLTGNTGPQGPQGIKGDTGDSGEGIEGPVGPQGIPGIDGQDGADSTVPGPQGIQGIPGIDGQDGADGSTTFAGLTDVDLSTNPANLDDSIKWDGINWVPYVPSSGGGGGATAYGNNLNSYSVLSNTHTSATYADHNYDYGENCLTKISGGDDNIAIGNWAFNNLTSGSDGIAIGANALEYTTTSSGNIGIGISSNFSNTTGSNNTSVGTGSMSYGSTGSYNSHFGYQAGYNNAAGEYNCSFGYQALRGNSSSYNIGIGYQAGYTGGGFNNIIMGRQSGYNNKASNNIFMGYLASKLNTTGSNIISIGNGAGISNTTGSDCVNIGNNVYFNRTSNSQSIGIGSYAGKLDQAGATDTSGVNTICIGYDSRVSGDNQIQMGNSSTSFYAYGAYNDRSDMRDKSDIRPTSLTKEFLLGLKPSEYRWDYRIDYQEEVIDKEEIIDEEGNIIQEKISHMVQNERDGSKKRNRFHQGFIAQEVKELSDRLGFDFGGFQDHSVNGGNDIMSLAYMEFIPVIVKTIQEQDSVIEDLIKRIELLESK